MTDKYEEFKEFVKKKYYPNPSRWGGIFNDFEKEQAEKEKKEEILKAIRQGLCECPYTITVDVTTGITIEQCIYNELKRKDLIK